MVKMFLKWGKSSIGAMSVFNNLCTYGLPFCNALFCTAYCFICVQNKINK